jgi:hypothetical protein
MYYMYMQLIVYTTKFGSSNPMVIQPQLVCLTGHHRTSVNNEKLIRRIGTHSSRDTINRSVESRIQPIRMIHVDLLIRIFLRRFSRRHPHNCPQLVCYYQLTWYIYIYIYIYTHIVLAQFIKRPWLRSWN